MLSNFENPFSHTAFHENSDRFQETDRSQKEVYSPLIKENTSSTYTSDIKIPKQNQIANSSLQLNLTSFFDKKRKEVSTLEQFNVNKMLEGNSQTPTNNYNSRDITNSKEKFYASDNSSHFSTPHGNENQLSQMFAFEDQQTFQENQLDLYQSNQRKFETQSNKNQDPSSRLKTTFSNEFLNYEEEKSFDCINKRGQRDHFNNENSFLQQQIYQNMMIRSKCSNTEKKAQPKYVQCSMQQESIDFDRKQFESFNHSNLDQFDSYEDLLRVQNQPPTVLISENLNQHVLSFETFEIVADDNVQTPKNQMVSWNILENYEEENLTSLSSSSSKSNSKQNQSFVFGSNYELLNQNQFIKCQNISFTQAINPDELTTAEKSEKFKYTPSTDFSMNLHMDILEKEDPVQLLSKDNQFKSHFQSSTIKQQQKKELTRNSSHPLFNNSKESIDSSSQLNTTQMPDTQNKHSQYPTASEKKIFKTSKQQGKSKSHTEHLSSYDEDVRRCGSKFDKPKCQYFVREKMTAIQKYEVVSQDRDLQQLRSSFVQPDSFGANSNHDLEVQLMKEDQGKFKIEDNISNNPVTSSKKVLSHQEEMTQATSSQQIFCQRTQSKQLIKEQDRFLLLLQEIKSLRQDQLTFQQQQSVMLRQFQQEQRDFIVSMQERANEEDQKIDQLCQIINMQSRFLNQELQRIYRDSVRPNGMTQQSNQVPQQLQLQSVPSQALSQVSAIQNQLLTRDQIPSSSPSGINTMPSQVGSQSNSGRFNGNSRSFNGLDFT
eukprot:403358677